MKARNIFRSKLADRCRGAVAVEAALILPCVALMFIATFYVGRVLWQYSVLKNVSASAARYVVQAPWAEIASGSRQAAAQAMAKQTLIDAGFANDVEVTIYCPQKFRCNTTSPLAVITVEVDMTGNGSNFLFPGGEVWAVTTVNYPK